MFNLVGLIHINDNRNLSTKPSHLAQAVNSMTPKQKQIMCRGLSSTNCLVRESIIGHINCRDVFKVSVRFRIQMIKYIFMLIYTCKCKNNMRMKGELLGTYYSDSVWPILALYDLKYVDRFRLFFIFL